MLIPDSKPRYGNTLLRNDGLLCRKGQLSHAEPMLIAPTTGTCDCCLELLFKPSQSPGLLTRIRGKTCEKRWGLLQQRRGGCRTRNRERGRMSKGPTQFKMRAEVRNSFLEKPATRF